MNPCKVFKTVLSIQSMLNNFLAYLSRLCNFLSVYIKKKSEVIGQKQSLEVLLLPTPHPVLPPFSEVTSVL